MSNEDQGIGGETVPHATKAEISMSAHDTEDNAPAGAAKAVAARQAKRFRLRNPAKMKRWLGFALVLGVLIYSGSAGTFSSFNAETDNPGNNLASGTLVLGNTPSGGGTCWSYSSGSGGNNLNSNCAVLLNSPNIEPGSWTTSGSNPQETSLTIQNAGSLPASLFYLRTPTSSACADPQTTSYSNGGLAGSSLTFNPTTGAPLCAAVIMFIQETSGSNNYCWYGPSNSSGYCETPVLSPTSASTSCPASGTITVSSLSGPINSGDSLTVSSSPPGTTCTVSASSSYAPSTGTVNISYTGGSYTAGSGTIGAGATVSDTNTLTTISASTATIGNFDSTYASPNKLTLWPINGADSINTAATTDLGAVSSRTFTIGLYLPNPSNGTSNALQGLGLTFSLNWYVQQ